MTNTKKLRALMLERGLSQAQIADYLGISATCLNYKINNKREFKASEIHALIELLGIEVEDIGRIFLVKKCPKRHKKHGGNTQ